MTISEYACDDCGYAYEGCGGLGMLEGGEGRQTVLVFRFCGSVAVWPPDRTGARVPSNREVGDGSPDRASGDPNVLLPFAPESMS